jgi:phosphatidylglycerol:prolipoprotein diacylglycerol transferase
MYPHLARIGPITIPTFGAVAALGLVLAILLAARGARVMRISEDAVWNLCLFTAGGTLVLSRVVIVVQVWKAFLHYPLYILTLPTVTKFGLLLAILCGVAYMFFKRLPWLRTADALAPAILLLQGALHLGTLFSGDDLGAATTLPVGHLIRADDGYHPVALYSAVLSLLAAAAAFAWLHRESQTGETFGLSLTMAALVRFFIDEFRPTYVLPDTFVGGFLRIDQLLLTLLAAAGLCFFFTRGKRLEQGAHYAQ